MSAHGGVLLVSVQPCRQACEPRPLPIHRNRPVFDQTPVFEEGCYEPISQTFTLYARSTMVVHKKQNFFLRASCEKDKRARGLASVPGVGTESCAGGIRTD